MRRAPLALAAILLAAVVLLAGCLGGQTDTAPPAENAGPPTEPFADWSNTTAEGTFTSINAVVLRYNPPDGDFQADFSVANGTDRLVLNLTTDGGEVDLLIAPPGCEVDVAADCEESASTSDGHLEWSTDGPETGEWGIRLFNNEPGVAEITWTLEIARLTYAVPDAPADG